jgi:hypothetical protein
MNRESSDHVKDRTADIFRRDKVAQQRRPTRRRFMESPDAELGAHWAMN